MLVYRVDRTEHINDLRGEGSRIFGARWNHKGVACIYTSESRALAVLEYSVNINVDDIPSALSIATIDINDSDILNLSAEDLPPNWCKNPPPADTKDFGSRLLSEEGHPVIRVPSTIIPEEHNYILNPRHAASQTFKLVDVQEFVYDFRIKTK